MLIQLGLQQHQQVYQVITQVAVVVQENQQAAQVEQVAAVMDEDVAQVHQQQEQ
jgi:hypothetical protein